MSVKRASTKPASAQPVPASLASAQPGANLTVLQTALRDLLRAHAPDATLLATVGEQVLNIRSDAPPETQPGSELVPPDDWLAGGDLAWITRDGALLGLLWSKENTIPAGAVEVLTLMLSAASQQGASREADMLITQLPAATAWLSADLQFKQVSRTFLELFSLSSEQVVGQTLEQVFASYSGLLPLLTQELEQAAAGRFVHISDIQPFGPGTRWLRGEAKPYFGGAAAGVLWTVQDVTAEHQQAAALRAILETETPLALLDAQGEVRQWSQGLSRLLAGQEAGADLPPLSPLWNSPYLTPESAGALQAAFEQAVTQAGQTRINQSGTGHLALSPNQSSEARTTELKNTEVSLLGGSTLSLSIRKSLTVPELFIVEGPDQHSQSAVQAKQQLSSQLLTLSESATILLDYSGRILLIGPQAAQLLDMNPEQMEGLNLIRTAQQMGMKLQSKRGTPLEWPDLRALPIPGQRELVAILPGGMRRQLEVALSYIENTRVGKKADILLTLRDLTALRQTQAKLQHDTQHDPLTGLLNRAGIRQYLSTAKSGMVAVIDMDGFGGLNAALGQTAGDVLLIQLAARLNDLCSDLTGRAARLNDDTFAVYLPHLSAEVGVQKLQTALQGPLRAGRRVVPMTFAIGTADLELDQPTAALNDAEMALQHAKRRGRSTVQLFNAGLRDEEAQNFELEAELRHAIEHDLEQFHLLYQPAISLKDGRAFGAEALLRWTHPTLGNIPPARFLPLAAHSDLLMELGEWVLREAAKGRAALRENGGQSDWRISVNLSLDELRHPQAAKRLLPLMSKSNALDIEVSAQSLLDYSAETLEVLESLRAKGSRLLVDDFGDFHSNLSALTHFPLSGLKLHPTLISRLPEDPKTITLVKGTVNLAHSLGLHVTAVGVETYPQLDLLRDLEVDAAQGYALTPPLNAQDLSIWLQNRH